MSAADPTDSPSGARVAVERLGREHPGGIVALDDVSLGLEAGEFAALTGPSGSGKTSLLSIIGALDQPTRGRVLVDDVPVTEPRFDRSRYHRDVVGFVFQHHFLLAHLDAVANVELALMGSGLGRRERRDRAAALLAEVGLAHRLKVLAARLSGGERQRVAVARALANEPRLLLADEPTGSLDSDSARRVLDLIATVRARRDMTMLVVTYDPLVAERADRVLHLRDGRLVAGGSPALRPAEKLGS